MYDRRDIRYQRALYAMARVVTDCVPEIKDREACRKALRAQGFAEPLIREHLTHVQYMARIIRGRDADYLAKKDLKNS